MPTACRRHGQGLRVKTDRLLNLRTRLASLPLPNDITRGTFVYETICRNWFRKIWF
ncbi:hypothetical protein LCGC14_1549110 [marine sediment metagenome]|uniref:Uncharacterized protein n=1 Tax=marine sediment metagenome TaxID=412755 RepID=A0A0F9LRN7_9ZZZZ